MLICKIWTQQGGVWAISGVTSTGMVVKKIKYRKGYYEIIFENYDINIREHGVVNAATCRSFKQFKIIEADDIAKAEAKAKAEAEENQKKANLKLVPNTGNRKSRRTKNKIK